MDSKINEKLATHFKVAKVFPEEGGNKGVVKGTVKGQEFEPSLAFSVTNFQESKNWKLREGDTIKIRLTGVCYKADISPPKTEKHVVREGPEKGAEFDSGFMGYIMPADRNAPENNIEFAVRGEIIDFKEFEDKKTKKELLWLYIDTKAIKLELIAEKDIVNGSPKKGDYVFALIQLQGYIEK